MLKLLFVVILAVALAEVPPVKPIKNEPVIAGKVPDAATETKNDVSAANPTDGNAPVDPSKVEVARFLLSTSTSSITTYLTTLSTCTSSTSCATYPATATPCRRRRGVDEKPIVIHDQEISPSQVVGVEATQAPAWNAEQPFQELQSSNSDEPEFVDILGIDNCFKERIFFNTVTVIFTRSITLSTFCSAFTTSTRTFTFQNCYLPSITTCPASG